MIHFGSPNLVLFLIRHCTLIFMFCELLTRIDSSQNWQLMGTQHFNDFPNLKVLRKLFLSSSSERKKCLVIGV